MRHSLIILAALLTACSKPAPEVTLTTIQGNDPVINYIGRFDSISSEGQVRQYAAGAYFTFAFEGNTCDIDLEDQNLYGEKYNYLEVIVDNGTPVRFRTVGRDNLIRIGQSTTVAPDSVNVVSIDLDNAIDKHTVMVCRDTETGMGYTAVRSITAQKIAEWTLPTFRRIEFIGNSITCGAEAFCDSVPYGEGNWGDRHMAYNAYGPRAARELQAQWSLTSVSGIGLIHSCCDMTITMPQVYDKINLAGDAIEYDFGYIPNVICICLGQNDGIQSKAKFIKAYRGFIDSIRKYYEGYDKIEIVVMSSPMADDELREYQADVLTTIVEGAQLDGDEHISLLLFSRSWNAGGGDHPDYNEHAEIAAEVVAHIKPMFKEENRKFNDAARRVVIKEIQ